VQTPACENCNSETYFDPEVSSSYRDLDKFQVFSYTSGNANGYQALETVCLTKTSETDEDVCVEDFKMAAVH
jgi:hypothetical protein